MDLDSIEGLNEIRPCVYRVSMKLLSLQKLCHLDVVSVRHVTAACLSVGGANLQQDVWLDRQEVTRTLNRMFHSVSQEVPGHVTMEAPEETCSLMFRLFDRRQAGCVSAVSLQTALIALSADSLMLKYRALVNIAETSSGSVSRSGLRSLLQDLSQVPAAVQEQGVFGDVEAAVKTCFTGVLTPTAGQQHVLSWLQSEPHLLLWLPTLYRLSVSQSVSHSVRCHTCKSFPITGLRYRCLKCVNVHVCQSCFLTDRHTKKHKTHHPVLEFCTQPTWRESLSSLVHSARHALLPRRSTQREADRRRGLMWAEPGDGLNRAPPPSDPATRLAASAVNHSPSSDREVSHDASQQTVQTDEEPQPQQLKEAGLITEVRNLQRDKWLLEQQLQAWRLTVQSEQGILEDRCSEMEVTMATLKEHNLCLQSMLTQALNKMEAQQHANNTPQRRTDDITPQRPCDDNTPQRPSDDNTPQRPSDDNTPRRPCDDNTPQRPSDDNTNDNTPQRLSDDNTPRRPSDDNTDDNTPRRPSDDNTPQRPSDDNTDDNTPQRLSDDNTPRRPSDDNTDDNTPRRPSDDNTPQRPSDDNTDDNTPQRPSDDNTPQRPSDDNTPQRPTDDNTPQRPSDDNTPQRPTDDNTPQRPSDDNTPQRPSDDNTPQRPSDDNTPQRPSDDNTDDNTPRSDGGGGTRIFHNNQPLSDVEKRPWSVAMETGVITPTSDTDSEGEEREEDETPLKTEDEWSEEEPQTPSPTMHLDMSTSHDSESESAGDWLLSDPIGQQDGAEEAGPQEGDACQSDGEEEEDCGTCSPEKLLQETVDRLRTAMETDRWRQRQTGEKRAELLEAADQVGDSIHRLVDAVRTKTEELRAR